MPKVRSKTRDIVFGYMVDGGSNILIIITVLIDVLKLGIVMYIRFSAFSA